MQQPSGDNTGSQKEPLHCLYEKGIIKQNPDALYRFIQRFKPVIYKYSRCTDRMHDFEDLVQYYSERIIYYHTQELKKEKKFDFTKKENEGLLVKFTKECVLQGVNLKTSKKKSQQHAKDYEWYVPIDECVNVRGKFISQENKLYQKDLVSVIKEKISKICPENVYKVFTVMLSGIESVRDIQGSTSLTKQEVLNARKVLQDIWRTKYFLEERNSYVLN